MITVQNLCKTYKVAKRKAGMREACRSLFRREYEEIHALDHISFQIEDGETIGYIGPNGAGKSTSIKVLSGILTPDEGTCVVNGKIPWKDRISYVKDIGVVFGQRSQLWWDVPVIDSFELLRDIYSIPQAMYKNNLEELTELLNLSELLKTPARQLSLGQRMRCEIAASLLHSPSILFLDEPTIGLDAVSKLAVRDFIKQLNQIHKTTVILTTHDMQDIEAITHRIMLIGKGRILMDGSPQELKQGASSMDEAVVKLYRSLEQVTIPGIVEKFFGVRARTVSSILLTIVMLAVGLSQMVAAGKLGQSLMGYDFTATCIVFAVVKPSFLLASCCKEDVVNGAAGIFRFSLILMLLTAKCAF